MWSFDILPDFRSVHFRNGQEFISAVSFNSFTNFEATIVQREINREAVSYVDPEYQRIWLIARTQLFIQKLI